MINPNRPLLQFEDGVYEPRELFDLPSKIPNVQPGVKSDFNEGFQTREKYPEFYEYVSTLPANQRRSLAAADPGYFRLNEAGIQARRQAQEKRTAPMDFNISQEEIDENPNAGLIRGELLQRLQQKQRDSDIEAGRTKKMGADIFDEDLETLNQIRTRMLNSRDFKRNYLAGKAGEYFNTEADDLTTEQRAIAQGGELAYDYRTDTLKFVPASERDDLAFVNTQTWIQSQSDVATELFFNNPIFQGFVEDFVKFGRDEGNELGLYDIGEGVDAESQAILDEIPDDITQTYGALEAIKKSLVRLSPFHEDNNTATQYFGAMDTDELPSSRLLLTPDPNFDLDEQIKKIKETPYYNLLLSYLGDDATIRQVTDSAMKQDHFYFLANRALLKRITQGNIEYYDQQRGFIMRQVAGGLGFGRDSFLASPDAATDYLFIGGSLSVGALTNLGKAALTSGIRGMGSRAVARRLAIAEGRRLFMKNLGRATLFAPHNWGQLLQRGLTKIPGVKRFATAVARDKNAKFFGREEMTKAFKRYMTFELAASFTEEYGAAATNQTYLNKILDDNEHMDRFLSKAVLMEGVLGGFIGIGVNRVFRGIGMTGMGAVNWVGNLGSNNVNQVGAYLQNAFQALQLQGASGADALYAQEVNRIVLDAAFSGVDLGIEIAGLDADGKPTVTVENPDIEKHPILTMIARLIQYNPDLAKVGNITLRGPDGEAIEIKKGPRFLGVVSNALEKAKETKRTQLGLKEGEEVRLTLDEATGAIVSDLIALMPESGRQAGMRDSIKDAALTTNAFEIEIIKLMKERNISRKEAVEFLNTPEGNDRLVTALVATSPELEAQILETLKDDSAENVRIMFETTGKDYSDPSKLKPRKGEKAEKLRAERSKDPQVRLDASRQLLEKITKRVSVPAHLTSLAQQSFGNLADLIANRIATVDAESQAEVLEVLASMGETGDLSGINLSESYVVININLPMGSGKLQFGIGTKTDDASTAAKTVDITLGKNNIKEFSGLLDLLGKEVSTDAATGAVDKTPAKKPTGPVDTAQQQVTGEDTDLGKDPEKTPEEESGASTGDVAENSGNPEEQLTPEQKAEILNRKGLKERLRDIRNRCKK